MDSKNKRNYIGLYTPRVDFIFPEKAENFKILVQKVISTHGTNKSADILGINKATMSKLVNKNILSVSQAKIILTNYKKWKANNV